MAKRFSHQISKTFHICKWISFTISTFVIVEEAPSAQPTKNKSQSNKNSPPQDFIKKTLLAMCVREWWQIICPKGELHSKKEKCCMWKRSKNTPPKPSEISMKNWSAKVKPVLTPHLWYKAMLKVWRKSWEPFRIYQLTSTANPAIIEWIGLDWLC